MGAIIEHLQACQRGQIKTLIMNVPPGCSKSLTTCVLFPAWVWSEDPNLRILAGSFDDGLVNRDARRSTELITSEWYRARWGNILVRTKPADGEIHTLAQGWRVGVCLGGTGGTGWHPDYKIVDDANKVGELTKLLLEKVKTRLSEVIGTRRRLPGKDCLISIQQRLHCNDGTAALLEQYPNAVHLSLPMEFDPGFRCKTFVQGAEFFSDPRTEKGELLVPERFTAEIVGELKKRLGPRAAAAQLAQRPQADGGAVFKREWFRLFEPSKPPAFSKVILSVDCTFKAKSDSDFVVVQAWGLSGPNMYLLAQERGRKNWGDTIRSIRAMAQRFPHAKVKLIEDKANGTSIIENLVSEMPGVIAVEPLGGKEARAESMTGLCEAGNVWIPDPRSPGFEWVDAPGDGWLTEVTSFPVGVNDDQVDCMTQAVCYLHDAAPKFLKAMAAVKDRESQFRFSSPFERV